MVKNVIEPTEHVLTDVSIPRPLEKSAHNCAPQTAWEESATKKRDFATKAVPMAGTMINVTLSA
jgi:hypothetical protein